MGDEHVDRATGSDRAPAAEPVAVTPATGASLTAASRTGPVTPSTALGLQRTAGNRATGRWLARQWTLARSKNEKDPRPLQLELTQERDVYALTEYLTVPRADGGSDLEAAYWASFQVEGDTMVISVRTRLADGTRSPTLHFGEQFDKAMAWFSGQGVDVRTIETEWSYMTPSEKSRNLSEYERLRSTGLSRQQAAEGTPSGQLLTAKGWRLSEIGPTRFEIHEHLSPTFGPDAVEPAERIHYPTQRAKWVRVTASTSGAPLAGAGTPSAGGSPPAAATSGALRPSTTGAGAASTGGFRILGAPDAGGLRASTGAQDLEPLAVGELNARGVARADAIGLALDMLNARMNQINDAEQKRRAEGAVLRLGPWIEEVQRERPECGVLVILVNRQLPVDGFSAIRPGPRFVGIEVGVGRDEREADRNREDSSIGPPREGETDTAGERIWIPAPHPTAAAVPAPPYPSAALATFTSGEPTLTDVWWGNRPFGFDDICIRQLVVPPGFEPRFYVLALPETMKAEIPNFRGRWVEENAIARGTSGGLPVARLDVYVPFDRDVAAAIFPADAATAQLFATTPPTRNWRLLRGVDDFDLVRWTTPDQILPLGD